MSHPPNQLAMTPTAATMRRNDTTMDASNTSSATSNITLSAGTSTSTNTTTSSSKKSSSSHSSTTKRKRPSSILTTESDDGGGGGGDNNGNNNGNGGGGATMDGATGGGGSTHDGVEDGIEDDSYSDTTSHHSDHLSNPSHSTHHNHRRDGSTYELQERQSKLLKHSATGDVITSGSPATSSTRNILPLLPSIAKSTILPPPSIEIGSASIISSSSGAPFSSRPPSISVSSSTFSTPLPSSSAFLSPSWSSSLSHSLTLTHPSSTSSAANHHNHLLSHHSQDADVHMTHHNLLTPHHELCTPRSNVASPSSSPRISPGITSTIVGVGEGGEIPLSSSTIVAESNPNSQQHSPQKGLTVNLNVTSAGASPTQLSPTTANSSAVASPTSTISALIRPTVLRQISTPPLMPLLPILPSMSLGITISPHLTIGDGVSPTHRPIALSPRCPQHTTPLRLGRSPSLNASSSSGGTSAHLTIPIQFNTSSGSSPNRGSPAFGGWKKPTFLSRLQVQIPDTQAAISSPFAHGSTPTIRPISAQPKDQSSAGRHRRSGSVTLNNNALNGTDPSNNLIYNIPPLQTAIVPQDGIVSKGEHFSFSLLKGRRRHMEDMWIQGTVCCPNGMSATTMSAMMNTTTTTVAMDTTTTTSAPSSSPPPPVVNFFGVADGHGKNGALVAQLTAQLLPTILQQQLLLNRAHAEEEEEHIDDFELTPSVVVQSKTGDNHAPTGFSIMSPPQVHQQRRLNHPASTALSSMTAAASALPQWVLDSSATSGANLASSAEASLNASASTSAGPSPSGASTMTGVSCDLSNQSMVDSSSIDGASSSVPAHTDANALQPTDAPTDTISLALQEAYMQLDQHVLAGKYTGGTTCTTLLIHSGGETNHTIPSVSPPDLTNSVSPPLPSPTPTLYVANVGDSRCILSRGGHAVALTSDHKPDRTDERARVERAGGHVVYVSGWRVDGALNVSRAIGDTSLKDHVNPHLGRVIARPETTVHTLGEEDEFCILASDGVWGRVSNQQAVDIVRKVLLSGGARNHEHKATTNDTSHTQPLDLDGSIGNISSEHAPHSHAHHLPPPHTISLTHEHSYIESSSVVCEEHPSHAASAMTQLLIPCPTNPILATSAASTTTISSAPASLPTSGLSSPMSEDLLPTYSRVVSGETIRSVVATPFLSTRASSVSMMISPPPPSSNLNNRPFTAPQQPTQQQLAGSAYATYPILDASILNHNSSNHANNLSTNSMFSPQASHAQPHLFSQSHGSTSLSVADTPRSCVSTTRTTVSHASSTNLTAPVASMSLSLNRLASTSSTMLPSGSTVLSAESSSSTTATMQTIVTGSESIAPSPSLPEVASSSSTAITAIGGAPSTTTPAGPCCWSAISQHAQHLVGEASEALIRHAYEEANSMDNISVCVVLLEPFRK